ncbi:MAG: hypothetical protein KQJ78_25495 [Deltaproteobacteria bacterium]|nr:hypothetical protein [Deltaproteobacteria bacterium]
MPEEIVVLSSSFSTYVKSFVNVKLGIVVLTNQRVFFREGSDVLFEIPLDQLKSFAEGKHGWSKKIILQTKDGVEYGFLPKKKHYDLWLKYLRDPQLITSATEEASPNKPVVQETFVPPREEAGNSAQDNQEEVANHPEVTQQPRPKEATGEALDATDGAIPFSIIALNWITRTGGWVGAVAFAVWIIGVVGTWIVESYLNNPLNLANTMTNLYYFQSAPPQLWIPPAMKYYGWWAMIWSFSIAAAAWLTCFIIELKQEPNSQ